MRTTRTGRSGRGSRCRPRWRRSTPRSEPGPPRRRSSWRSGSASTPGRSWPARMGDQYTVIGDTVNVAARLQAASRIGAVTVGASTRRLTAAAIEYRDLEPLTLKGKSEPIPAWEAVGVVDSASQADPARAAAPLVGRDEELALLRSLFERAVRESRPYLVTVFGQAGVGKSRLLRSSPPPWATARSQSRRWSAVRPPTARPLRMRRSERSCASGSESPAPRRRKRESPRSSPGSRTSPEGWVVGDRRRRPHRDADRPGARNRHAGRRPRGRRSRAGPRSDLRGGAAARGAPERTVPGRPGDRGHPLGRRGHARPDRAPGRLGTRAGADRLPGSRRAARAPAYLGRRQTQCHDDLARPPVG